MARFDPRPLNSDRWRATRAFVAQRASLRCEHCHRFLGLSGQVDHIVPRADCALVGIGVFDPTNLQYLCPSCHSAKSARERWAGHIKNPPKQPTRTRVTGREQYLDAAGILLTPERKNPDA